MNPGPLGHVGYAEFGLKRLETETEAEVLLRTVDKTLTSIEAQMLLREAYDQSFGIYDHTNDPLRYGLGLVTTHKAENYGDYGPILHMIYKYRFYDIYRHFGLSLTEFLALPREYTQYIFEVVSHENQVTTKGMGNLMSGMDPRGRGQ